MISSSIFNIASTVADSIQSATGRRIFPSSSTALSNLVGLSYTGVRETPGSELSVSEAVETLTSDSAQGPNDHSFAKGVVSDELIPLVSSHIFFVQNTVKPRVVDMQQKLEAFIEENTKNGVASMFNIQAVNAPAMADDEAFMSFIDRFADDSIQQPLNLNVLPALDYDRLVEVMSISNRSVDDQVKVWLADKGRDWLMGIWSAFFAGNALPVPSDIKGSLLERGIGGLMSLPMAERMEVSAAVFLLARGLFDTPPDVDGVNMTLNQWREVTDKYSRWAALAFMSANRQYDATRKNDMLVIGITDGGYGAIVYEPALNAFLESGGCIETVLGAVVSNKQSTYTKGHVEAESANYMAVWENFQTVGEQTMRARLNTAIRSYAVSLYTIGLNDLDAAEKEYYDENSISYESTIKLAQLHMNDLPGKSVLDSQEVALDLVAGIRFAFTPARQFLGDMLAAQESGCKNPAEAAAAAAVNYVADFLSTQVALSSL